MLLCCCMLSQSISSHRRDVAPPSAEDPARLLVPRGIYRKLTWESRRRVTNTMDIAPNICIGVMFAVIIYTVSLAASYYLYIFTD